PRHAREIGDGLGNEGRGLIRPAVPQRIVGSRTAIPALGWTGSPAPCLGQKTTSQPEYCRKIPFLRAQLQDVICNSGDAKALLSGTLSTSVDLTGGSAAPMFGSKRPTRVSRNRPL